MHHTALPVLFQTCLLPAAALLLSTAVPGYSQPAAPPGGAGPVVLENALLRITVDGKTGAVVGLFNKQTNTEYLSPRPNPQPPFIVDQYSANQSIYINDPFEAQSGGFSLYNPAVSAHAPGDLTHAREPVPGSVHLTHVKTDQVDRLECSCRLPGGIAVTYTIALQQNSPLTEWRVHVENHGGEAPSRDQRVYRVAFPVLEGLCIGGKHQDNFLARPFAQGELIPDPSSYDFMRPGGRTPIFVLTYPGWASMSWMDQYAPGGGLYLASHDLSFQQMDLEAWPDPAAGTMTLDTRTLAWTLPGGHWDSQPFTLGVHTGDWHWGADRYREWARANFRRYTGPAWPRREADGWFGTGGPTRRYSDYLAMYDDAQWLGLNYLQIWSEMLENVGPDKSRKAYYCFLWPDPDRGGEAEMTSTVHALRAKGAHIGFYDNIWTWDAGLAEGLAQWKDQLPPDVHVPQWWGEARTWASVFPDGSRRAGNWGVNGGTEYAGMCPDAAGYQDYVLSWVLDRYVKRYGVDTWYFDSMPVTMFSAARVCFSDEHGPGRPHGIGQGFLEMLNRLTTGARSTVNLAVCSETICDALMQYDSHALGVEYLEGLTRYVHPEVYAYTWPEHAIYSGTCDGAGSGLKYYWPDVGDHPRRQDTMNHVFLMGSRYDILMGSPINRSDPFLQYLRKLIALRAAVKSEIYGADFRDEIGLGQLPDHVYAKLFRRTDGAGLELNLVDRRPAPGAFALTVDLTQNSFPAPGPATLYEFDGRQTPLESKVDRGVLTLQVPALQGEVGAIVIRRR
jgi:hypothetical protein